MRMVNAMRWTALIASACLLVSACAETSPAVPPAVERIVASAAAPPAPRLPEPVLISASELTAPPPRPAVLIFSRTRGYRHRDAIPAANAMFAEIGARRGWTVVFSEDERFANTRQLDWFDAIVFNNTSGTLFSDEQRSAFRAYIEQGGGFVGVHGAGGDPSYLWLWYVYDLLGSRFIGHPPIGPMQFQQATIRVEDRTHPATRHLPAAWVRTDEWYSFAGPARRPGFRVLATLDESTYAPGELDGRSLAMGADHPIMWEHCEGRGRVFYSALGHQASAYSEPDYARTLEGAVAWAARQEGDGCA
jgi:type 1 glutamine amidotransferase